MFKHLITILSSIMFLILAGKCYASGFSDYLTSVKERAYNEGISSNTANQILDNVIFIDRVIELDQSQPSKTMSFSDYKTKIITKQRIKDARSNYKANKQLLDEVAKIYKVQPRFIVALWALESNFGQRMGNFDVLSSLATLGYEGRRGEFFTGELINAMKIVDRGDISSSEMLGSWAGAMGQTQFMPSSYLSYAVDFNNDGKKDIWNTRGDVFASIANYLANHGWDNNMTWGRRITLPKNFDNSLIGNTTEKSLKEWQQLGITSYNGSPLPNAPGVFASVAIPDESNRNEVYLIYNNYKVILKWNRSLYFATSVGLLADAISEDY